MRPYGKVIRRKQRRAYLKSFSADVTHIKQAPLRAPEEGLRKITDYHLIADGKGEKTKHDPEGLLSVRAHTRLISEEGRYDTFALKSRNQAAQELFPQFSVHYDKNGELTAIAHDGIMRLPVIRQADGSILIMRTSGPDLIPRAEVFFKLWQGTRRQSITKYHSTVLEQGKWVTVRYFFAGTEHLIIHESRMRNVIKRSIPYRSRALMIQALQNNLVVWEQIDKLIP